MALAPHPTLLPPRLPAPAPVPAGGGLGYASPPLQQPLRPPPPPPGGVGPSSRRRHSHLSVAGYELLPPQPAATATTAALETATTAPTVAAAPPRAIGVVNAPLQAQYATHVIGSDTPEPISTKAEPQNAERRDELEKRHGDSRARSHGRERFLR